MKKMFHSKKYLKKLLAKQTCVGNDANTSSIDVFWLDIKGKTLDKAWYKHIGSLRTKCKCGNSGFV